MKSEKTTTHSKHIVRNNLFVDRNQCKSLNANDRRAQRHIDAGMHEISSKHRIFAKYKVSRFIFDIFFYFFFFLLHLACLVSCFVCRLLCDVGNRLRNNKVRLNNVCFVIKRKNARDSVRQSAPSASDRYMLLILSVVVWFFSLPIRSPLRRIIEETYTPTLPLTTIFFR